MTGGAPTAPPEGPAISGTLAIAPDLAGRVRDTAVVFIIARRPSGPLFAVKRIAPPRFPLAYRIGPEDVMMAGEAFDGEARVSARVSQTGSAGPPQPGDLEGEAYSGLRPALYRNLVLAVGIAYLYSWRFMRAFKPFRLSVFFLSNYRRSPSPRPLPQAGGEGKGEGVQ
jgi:hypothetical protein